MSSPEWVTPAPGERSGVTKEMPRRLSHRVVQKRDTPPRRDCQRIPSPYAGQRTISRKGRDRGHTVVKGAGNENKLVPRCTDEREPAIIQRLAKPLLHPILLPARGTFTSSGSRPQRIADYANGSRIIAAPNDGGS
ncbi:unnamed protein product [Pleuronectes platessa]|uniref:Uncharacterized protein n=1 Tax=Pleuronectes platessa TaxID=8262 RepID=A0A9N7UD21_PLEPL|nr:unnamed protein product [Pleuronectes platessa]